MAKKLDYRNLYNVAETQVVVENGIGKNTHVVLGEKLSWNDAVELRKAHKGSCVYKTPVPHKKKHTKASVGDLKAVSA